MVKDPPYTAGDMGSIPGWGTRIPHVRATKPTEPQLLNLHLPQPEGPCATREPTLQ